MRKVLLGSTAVGLVVVLFFAAWEAMGDDPIRPAALAAVPATSLESPNGLYKIEATDTGILLSGPGVLVKVDGAQVRVQAPLVRLCGGGGRPVARLGDLVPAAPGPIAQGSPTTLVC